MRVIEALILGICVILAAAIFGILHYESRLEEDVISVVGTATKRFESDIVKWRINISRLVGLNDLKGGYTLIQGDSKTVIEELKSSGIGDKEIGIQPVNTIQRYDNYGQPTGYELQQTINVISGNISKIENLALNPGVFFDKGVIAQFYLEYYFSKLSEIKRELLAEATHDARKRAEEIAANSEARIDKINSARSGVFQITEPYSTEVSDYGIYSTSTRIKDITVTVHVSFTLK
jgi:hypothetical protein